MRILIAEDDPTSRTLLAAVLEKQGHEVCSTGDGVEAWNVLDQPDAPRLAILDWMMPVLTGADVCRRVRARPGDQPPYLILLTALTDKAHVAEGLEAGADDYLAKPFDVSELRARIAVGMRTLALQERLHAQAQELRTALAQVKTLRGIVPMCSHCKRIRDDKAYWNRVEEYVAAHTLAVFSHGVCPECVVKHYPDDAAAIADLEKG